jgi:hypothetical protein
MRRFLLLALFVALPLDLAVVDAPLLPNAGAGARALDWEDEEQSAPSRRPRPGREQCHADPAPPGQRSAEPDAAERRAQRAARVDGHHRAVAWLVPIRQVYLPASRSAAPPEDH